MSKKSRKRNKKILAALALAGGAAMLGRRGKGAVTGVPLNPNLQKTIAADAGADIAEKVVPADAAAVSTGNAQSRFTTQGPDGTWRGPMEHKSYMAALPGAGVTAPPSILNPWRHIPGGGRLRRKGGGIAKRGMGAAYKSGGRVKSMGIAKRGGGVAKR